MQSIKMGTKAKSTTIGRSAVAEKCKARAILVDKNPRVKNIAWDDTNKIAVEVTQEEAIQLRLTPRSTYFFLIARCNTDMTGKVVGDDVILEYIQLSEQTYQEYIDIMDELGAGNSLVLQKVDKKSFSYVKVSPSTYNGFSPALTATIKEIRSNKALVEGAWSMVDMATSRTIEEYYTILDQRAKAGGDSGSSARRALEHKSTAPASKRITADSGEMDFGDEAFDEPEEATYEEVNDTEPKPKDISEPSPEELAGADDFGDFEEL